MSSTASHPAERLAPDVRTIRGRATLAVVSLAATAACRLFALGVALWQNALIAETTAAQANGQPIPMDSLNLSDRLTQLGTFGVLGLLVVTGVLFLSWLHGVIRVTRALGASSLQWKPGDAISAFLVPFQSFIRPFHVIRDVHEALNPHTVPEPTARPVVGDGMNYRQVEIETPPPQHALPDASIGAWWASFWIGNIAARIASSSNDARTLETIVTRNNVWALADVVEVVSAALAILVVRAVTARLMERYRRIRHNDPETLVANGVVIEDLAA